MTRQNVYTYPDDLDPDDAIRVVGHFDIDRATEYPEATRIANGYPVSINADNNFGHQGLFRTAGGRWVLRSWSQWQGSVPRWEFIDIDGAVEWLIRNEYGADEIAQATGEAIPEESGPYGRPAVGPRVYVRMDEEMLSRVDAQTRMAGVTRSEWLRSLIAREVGA